MLKVVTFVTRIIIFKVIGFICWVIITIAIVYWDTDVGWLIITWVVNFVTIIFIFRVGYMKWSIGIWLAAFWLNFRANGVVITRYRFLSGNIKIPWWEGIVVIAGLRCLLGVFGTSLMSRCTEMVSCWISAGFLIAFSSLDVSSMFRCLQTAGVHPRPIAKWTLVMSDFVIWPQTREAYLYLCL